MEKKIRKSYKSSKVATFEKTHYIRYISLTFDDYHRF